MADISSSKAAMAAPALSPPSETDALAVGLGAMVVGGGVQSQSGEFDLVHYASIQHEHNPPYPFKPQLCVGRIILTMIL